MLEHSYSSNLVRWLNQWQRGSVFAFVSASLSLSILLHVRVIMIVAVDVDVLVVSAVVGVVVVSLEVQLSSCFGRSRLFSNITDGGVC